MEIIMKMQSEHYEYIKSKIIALGIPQCKQYRDNLIAIHKVEREYNDINVRLMYDLQRFAVGSRYVTETLYPYINDNHVKTALLSIAKELELYKEENI